MTSSSRERRIRILYLAGWGRSGSTLLGNLLGQVDGFAHHGELRFFWDRGLREDQLCSCGVSFHECPFWSEVLEQAFATQDRSDLDYVRIELSRLVRTRQTARRLLRRRLGRPLRVDPKVVGALASLYRALHDVTGAQTLVDSSKLPSYGELLTTLPATDVTTIHLVRDPRAVAFSWRRRRLNPGTGREMARHSAVRSSLAWLMTNAELEAMRSRASETRRVLRLRYEDLISRPLEELQACVAAAGHAQELGHLIEDGAVFLQRGHNLSGNPLRFTEGSVALSLDEEWKHRQSRATHLLVTAIALPLLSRYRYPWPW